MRSHTVRFAVLLGAMCLTAACSSSPGDVTAPSPPVSTPGDSSPPALPVDLPPREPGPNPPAPPPPASGGCDHTSAQWAIGQRASTDLLERARVAGGARSARFLRPNETVTLEYLATRLNLGLDTRNIVRSVVCW